jgi:hypothetical protein
MKYTEGETGSELKYHDHHDFQDIHDHHDHHHHHCTGAVHLGNPTMR